MSLRSELKEKQTCNKRIIREVAHEQKLSPMQVEEIFNFTTKFTADVISSGKFANVMIPGFGKFAFDVGRFVKMVNRKENETDK